MYCIAEMLNIGLGDREWPNDDYKQVAETLVLCNPQVNTTETMTDVIDAVFRVPEDEITKVTAIELVKKYQMPKVF